MAGDIISVPEVRTDTYIRAAYVYGDLRKKKDGSPGPGLVPRHQILRAHPAVLYVVKNRSAGRARKIWSGDETNLASFPGLPRFSSSVCVQCIILNANRRTKTGEAWERG